MISKKSFVLWVVFTTSLLAQSENIVFPKDFEKGILYFKNDRGNITEEIFVDKGVIQKVQNNKPIPSGTVITLVEYYAKDKKGDDGYALKDSLKRYVVMEKRTGWNKNLPDSKKSGEWKYQVFNPDRTINSNENLNRCVSCHASKSSNDFVFTLDDMKRFNLE